MCENNSLKTCSRCHSTMLCKYFSTNKKGKLYKLCDNCRKPKQNKPIHITPEEAIIAIERQKFIEAVLKSDKIEYLGQLSPNNEIIQDAPFLSLPNCQGDEVAIEYHLFNLIESNTPLVHRWRLRNPAKK